MVIGKANTVEAWGSLMPDAIPENIPSAKAEEGIEALSELCKVEYGPNINQLMEDTSITDEMRLLRIGRLIGITLKQPFADSHTVNPRNTKTWASRGWEVREEFHGFDDDFRLLTQFPTESSTWQYDVLNRLRGEEGYRSVPELMNAMNFERRFFSALARSFHKHVCGDANLCKQLHEAAGDTTTIAVLLVQALPLLVVAPPVLGGFVLIVKKYGISEFCAWIDQKADQVDE